MVERAGKARIRCLPREQARLAVDLRRDRSHRNTVDPADAADRAQELCGRIDLQRPNGERQRVCARPVGSVLRSEEHTSELQSLMSISYAVFCLKTKKTRSYTRIDFYTIETHTTE